jgi:hypothetical protein
MRVLEHFLGLFAGFRLRRASHLFVALPHRGLQPRLRPRSLIRSLGAARNLCKQTPKKL